MTIVLASQSAGRIAMLRAAGVRFEAHSPLVDEDSIRQSLALAGAKPRDVADSLAEAKARKLARKFPAALVIGCDQILVTADGKMLDKPVDPQEAKAHLEILSASTHRLISAIVIVENAKPVWRVVDTASLTMRSLSTGFITAYVDQNWQDIQHCVGCYRIEAEGAQLFSSVQGSQFTIVGLPLLPLLDYLRVRSLLPT